MADPSPSPTSLLEDIYGADWDTNPDYLALPVLEDQDKVGSTHYMDRFVPGDFPDGVKVMRGKDCYGRFFLAALVQEGVVPQGQMSVPPNNWTTPGVLCFFQRYSDNPTFWAQACGDRMLEGFETGGLDRAEKAQIVRMLQGESVTPLPEDTQDAGCWIGSGFEALMRRRIRLI